MTQSVVCNDIEQNKCPNNVVLATHLLYLIE